MYRHFLHATIIGILVVYAAWEGVMGEEGDGSLTTVDPPTNTTEKEKKNCTIYTESCKKGMILPKWEPVDGIGTGDRVGRALLYFMTLIYMFLGVSIVADRFMAAIEVITSKEREITVKKKNGEVFTVTVKTWNETVSNLTLMALGSSAPEIMLSVIEVCGRGFNAGELGPNTIVGSAAFNLFMIMAICVYVIPSPETRVQKHLPVFCVTATWSVFAYVWLYIILSVSSEGIIEIWEGVVTFLFFPLTVLTAYIADRRLFPKTLMGKRFKATAAKIGEEDVEMMNEGMLENVPEAAAFEKTRHEFMEIFRELRQKHPNKSISELQEMAEYEMLNRGPKSRAFYRVQATRKLVGGGNVIKRKMDKDHNKSIEALNRDEDLKLKYTTKVFFDPAHYTVLENVGTFDVVVTREGGPPDTTVMVDYRTEDGSANAGSDYVGKNGTITLTADDHHARIPIQVIDDDVFEEDEHFYIHLENIRVRTRDGLQLDPSKLGGMPMAELEPPFTATVMILDDDHAGVFGFAEAETEAVESCGDFYVKVMRNSGARGKVLIPYKTYDGTAVGGRDYEALEGELVFDNDEVEKYIKVGIVDDQDYEKNEDFYIELFDPIWAKNLTDQSKVIERYLKRKKQKQERAGSHEPEGDADKSEAAEQQQSEDDKIAEMGRPKIGEASKCKVRIKESMEFKSVVDRVIKTGNISAVLGTSSWKEQFIDALNVSAGDDDDDGGGGGDEDEEGEEGEGGEAQPSLGDYVMHYITLPWKLLFAFIPPTDYWGGWACFVVSILGIAFITAFIGDIASAFGCTIGLKDAVTAISLVALGTSVPDTFASKVSAVQDPHSDSSIGNVTGSNAVNVFLGIGIAWTMCAVYQALQTPSQAFEVNPGTLAYSVCIFCAEAVICIIILVIKRHPKLGGGELGGPMWVKLPVTIFFVILWLLYVILSSLESYCVIKGF